MSALLAIRPDFRFHIFDNDRVIFLSDSSHYLLSNVIFVHIARALENGPIFTQNLTSQLTPKFDEKLIVQALKLMVERGVLIEDYSSIFSQGARAFWYENGLNAQLLESLMKSRQLSVKAFCSDINQVEVRFKLFFEKFGFHFNERADCSVFIVDNYLNHDLDQYLKSFRKNDHPWTLLKIEGSKIWIGPFFNDSGNNCWECLIQSLKLNRRVEVDLFGHDKAKLGVPTKVSMSCNEDLAFRFSAIQIARWLLDSKNCPISNQLISIDPFNLKIENHQYGIIKCESCIANQDESREVNSYQFTKSPIIFRDENGCRSAHPERTYEILNKIVSPITGIVPAYSLFQVNGDYVASSIRNLPNFEGKNYEINKSLRVPDVAVGKGKTKLQAKIGCFAESVERYNSTFLGYSQVFSKYQDLPHNGIGPEKLLLFSEKQYENRDRINKSFGSFNQVPKRYDGSEIRWTSVQSLSGGDVAFIPSSYCYLNYPFQNEIDFCPGDTNGCASGNTIEEAIFYAILELVERDAVAIWWYNKIQYPGINTESLTDSILVDLIEVHRRQGRIFNLIDITSDLNIPVFVAVSSDSNGDRIHFGTACHFDPTIAMIRAVRELNQIMTHTTLDKAFAFENVHPGQKEFAKWVTSENLRNHTHLNPLTKNNFQPEKYTSFHSDDFLDYINEFNALFEKKGLYAYWLNLSQANIEFSTVKVIIPGLRHFWNRLGPGRLYDAPVELGMISSPKAEDQMNKTPYFL